MAFPTGTQFELRAVDPAGALTATITEVGASLRSLSVGGVDLVPRFADELPSPSCAGVVLVPWPNRVRDAVWTDGDIERSLAVTEPALDNAIHGLLRFSPYTAVARTESSVTLEAVVFPQTGYPYHLDTGVTYELVPGGLRVTHTIRNIGEGDAPVAVGTHPFLTIGDLSTDDLVLRVAADTHIDVDERLNPTGTTPVDGTPFDLRNGIRVGDIDLDDAWADVHVVDGESAFSLTAADGRSVSLWADDDFGFVQVYNTREFPGLGGPEPAIAIEPMTAPADAFNSGWGLRRLAPGESWTMSWGIRFAGF